MKEFNTLDDFDVENKTVLLRVDFNMPLDKNTLEILDTTRIKLVIPTIKELIEKNAKIVILAHQGRRGSWDFISLEKHANALEGLLGKEVKFVDDIFGEKAKDENGYLFEDRYTTIYLGNAFESGHLQPGQEYQGEISFEIPKSSENIEMWYSPYSGPYIYVEL